MNKFTAILYLCFISGTILSQCFASYPLDQAEVREFNLGNPAQTTFTCQGFSGPEGTHRWTNNKVATVTLNRSEGTLRMADVTFSTHALASATHHVTLQVFVNNKLKKRVKYTSLEQEKSINVNLFSQSDPLVIKFETDCIYKPGDIIPDNTDPRELGISFSTVRATYFDYNSLNPYPVQEPQTFSVFCNGKEIQLPWNSTNQEIKDTLNRFLAENRNSMHDELRGSNVPEHLRGLVNQCTFGKINF